MTRAVFLNFLKLLLAMFIIIIDAKRLKKHAKRLKKHAKRLKKHAKRSIEREKL